MLWILHAPVAIRENGGGREESENRVTILRACRFFYWRNNHADQQDRTLATSLQIALAHEVDHFNILQLCMAGEPFCICKKYLYIVWCNDRRWEQNIHQELKAETRTGTDTMSSSLHLMISAGENCGCCRWSRYKLRHDSRHNWFGHKVCQLWAECIGHRFCETWRHRLSISIFTHCVIYRWRVQHLERRMMSRLSVTLLIGWEPLSSSLLGGSTLCQGFQIFFKHDSVAFESISSL